MTNLPSPGQSLNLVPGSTPSPVHGAAAETVQWTGQLTIGTRAFTLVPTLSPFAMIELQEAQESGQLREIVKSVQYLVAKVEREALVEYLLADPDDANDTISIDDVVAALNNGMEQISARPTVK